MTEGFLCQLSDLYNTSCWFVELETKWARDYSRRDTILQSLLIHNEQAKLEPYKGWTEEDPRKLTHQKEQVTRKWREKVVNKDLIIQLLENKGVQGTLQKKNHKMLKKQMTSLFKSEQSTLEYKNNYK